MSASQSLRSSSRRGSFPEEATDLRPCAKYTRRDALRLLVGGAAMTIARAESGATKYQQDVDFLLVELEKKAGRFFDTKKINWKAVSAEFRSAAAAVKTDADHLALCGRLVARLRDGHAGLVDRKVPWPDESQGRRFTGPRVHLVEIGDRVFVRRSFGAGVPLGVVAGAEILAIDGVPIRDWLDRTVSRMREKTGYSTDHAARYYACHTGLADWEGTKIEFTFLSNGERKTATVTRSGGPNFVPIGPTFPPGNLQRNGRQSFGRAPSGLGYIHLRDVPGNLPEQLDAALAAIGDVPGLILDMRANGGGGCDHAAVFGRFIPSGKTWQRYSSAGPQPFGGPMVVIVDAGVRSAGETVAGQFKEDGRALMIGESATAGMSSQKEKLPVPSGLFAVYFSVRSNMGRFNSGRGIEGIGVGPHVIVPAEPEDLKNEVDTQIRVAAELIARGFPKGMVAWPG